MLRVADEEGADAVGVEEGDELVNARVKDGFADEAQRAVPDCEGVLEAVGADAGDTAEGFDFLGVRGFCLGEDEGWGVGGPAPGGADGVGAMAPAEDALVGAGEGRGGFHAEVRGDAVEGVLVAGSVGDLQLLVRFAKGVCGIQTWFKGLETSRGAELGLDSPSST